MKSWLIFLFLTAFVPGMSAQTVCPTTGPENDGNGIRACETWVVGSGAGNGDVREFHPYNLAEVPNGGLMPGDGYIYVKAQTLHFEDIWHPSSSFGHLSFCKDGANEPRGEQALLFRQRLVESELKNPWEFVGRLSACGDVVGDAQEPKAWTIGGTIGRGQTPFGLKYYVFGNRTKCVSWPSGCMDAEFIGAATSPTGLAIANPPGTMANDDKSPATWRLSPFLRLSDPSVDGTGNPLSFNSVVAVASYAHDPAPPAWLARITDPSLGSAQATMWGFLQWGYLSEHPARVAAFQIVDNGTTLRPNFSTMSVWIYASDQTWKKVNSDGSLTFVPFDARAYFPKVAISGLLYYNGRWNVTGHSGQILTQPLIGCDESSAPFTAQYPSPGYITTNSIVAMQELYPNSTTRLYSSDTETQNSQHWGALIFPVGSSLYTLRASTERMCYRRFSTWGHPSAGHHLTLEALGTPITQ